VLEERTWLWKSVVLRWDLTQIAVARSWPGGIGPRWRGLAGLFTATEVMFTGGKKGTSRVLEERTRGGDCQEGKGGGGHRGKGGSSGGGFSVP
jgi:hypothetical protein